MKSKKVLIVDSNDLNRKLFESLIGQLASVESVKNRNEAMDKASTEKFDLILMDVLISETEGISALKTIRRQAAHPCPILAITSHSSESARKCFLEMGFDDVVTKPIRPKEFMALISALVGPEKENPATSEATSDVLDQSVFRQLLKFNSVETIQSIYVDFLQEFDQLIHQIDHASVEKNQQTLMENLHTLKGNSGTLGANTIFNLSSEADMKVRSLDWDSLETVLGKLKNERVIFEKYLKEEPTFRP